MQAPQYLNIENVENIINDKTVFSLNIINNLSSGVFSLVI